MMEQNGATGQSYRGKGNEDTLVPVLPACSSGSQFTNIATDSNGTVRLNA